VTPERWRHIKDLLASALEREPEQREQYVAVACGDDAELRGAIESLIRADAHQLIPADPEGVAAPPPQRPEFQPGARLGRYEVCGLLAAGGMGEVYRVRDTRLGREVALKVLPDAFAADAARRARFEREARVLAALNHPHIVTLHSLEEEAGLHFLTMELVQGRTLDHLIPQGGLGLDALAGYALPLSGALAAAHERGIVHRDLKPGNVMLADDGRLKLLDFGLATVATGSEASAPWGRAGKLTSEGLLVGTCRYMSPEQLQGRPLDCRSDVFALGVVLYEMAVGRSPFGGVTTAETCSAILREQPPALAGLRADLPRALSELIMRCLEKDPARRYADAGEVHRELPALTRGPVLLTASAPAPPPSVAVLPFLNLSTSVENEFFADGITEDVIAHLSKIRSLKVISRTSVTPFRKREQSLREVGAILGVGAILEGSVRRAGDRVRIVAQLIDAGTDMHLWAETYDRDLTDIFAIQTEVALQIAAALRAELSPGERTRIRRAPTQNLDAYQLYLQGRNAFRRYTDEGFRQGIQHFERAIAEDPGFALAHVGLACVYAESPNEGFLSLRPEMALGRAKEAVARALALDDSLGDAHGIRGLLKFIGDYDWPGAEEDFKRAIELSPGSADVYDHYGWMCSALERFDEAIRLAQRARELDPMAHRSDLANELLRAGRLQEAVELGARIVELEPGFSRGHAVYGWACLLSGRQADGVAALARAVALSEGGTLFLGQLGQAYAMTGDVARARDVLRKLHALAGRGYVSPYHFAYVHTGLGEQEEALDWLERAFEERAGAIYGIKGSFLFRSLRFHPRFTALLKKMNLA
jgi:eukaryotic-like serine/threonine-protein kinase